MFFENGIDNTRCDVNELHDRGLSTAKDNDIFVEIGVFMGESLHCLINKIQASNKKINLYAVDKFDLDFMLRETKDGVDQNEYGHPLDRPMGNGETPEAYIKRFGTHKALLVDFFNKLKESNKEKYLKGCLVGKSWDIAETFCEKSIHFCFIDAGHSYQAVKKDLETWYPKMKDNGLFCGHDWFGEGVQQAVKEFAQNNNLKIESTSSSWILTK